MRFALRSAARRYRSLSEEVAGLDAQPGQLVAEVAPDLVALPGVGTDHAATLLLAAGDNPQRLRSEVSFASLWGVSPAEICVVRMRVDERTHRYVALRTAEGKPNREIMRCLKRYVAREVYRIVASAASPSPIRSCTRSALST